MNKLRMDQLVNVLLATDKAHTEGPGLQTRLRWVKPGLRAHPSHSSLVFGQIVVTHSPSCAQIWPNAGGGGHHI